MKTLKTAVIELINHVRNNFDIKHAWYMSTDGLSTEDANEITRCIHLRNARETISDLTKLVERLNKDDAVNYFNVNGSHVSDAQLERFKLAMYRQWCNTANDMYESIKLLCEIEETDRAFSDDLMWLAS